VPRTQRSAPHLRRGVPQSRGPSMSRTESVGPGSAEQRCTLHRVRDTDPPDSRFNIQTAERHESALSRRGLRPSFASTAPEKQEGVGNAGCPLHPQPRVRFALVKMHTSKRVHRNHPTFPHAMVLTVSFALSSVTGLFCHRRPRTDVVPKPGRADITSANLTPASGRQDHATSPSTASSLVRSLLTAHGVTRPAIPSRAKRCRVHRIRTPRP
jgi:hypothetical protein